MDGTRSGRRRTFRWVGTVNMTSGWGSWWQTPVSRVGSGCEMHDCVIDRLLWSRWHLRPLALSHVWASELRNHGTDSWMMTNGRVQNIDTWTRAVLVPHSSIELGTRPPSAIVRVCSNYVPELPPPALKLVLCDQTLDDHEAMPDKMIRLRCGDLNSRIDWATLQYSWRLLIGW